jgi:CRP-like cAMP-binding protein
MNSQIILSHINGLVKLDKDETEYLESVLISRPFDRGELIVKSGEAARFIMFVNSGYLMTYYTDKEDTDHVIQFASSGWWAGDIYSLSKETNTLYSTMGLCKGEVFLLPRAAQNQLLDTYSKFERYFRMVFQHSLMRHQMRFVESHSQPAVERYRSFLTIYPGIEKYIAQKYIASYLGITPEFLSKTKKTLLQEKH